MVDITERTIKTKYGTFHFELVEYPGPSPLVSVTFGGEHIGWYNYINLNEVSDLELLEFVIKNVLL